jgi:LacI family transcriptional regulator
MATPDNARNVRIKDIARLAGVSVGTVDRVLHNRGRVSEEAMRKVLKVLEEIDYKPNVIARTLGANKTYRIAALLPNPAQDPYWALTKDGIDQAQAEWMRYGVTIEPHFFDQYAKDTLAAVASKIVESPPDGVLVAPIFYHESLPHLKSFEELNVPYVLVNTRIENIASLSFIGQDLYQSGKLGGELMHLSLRETEGIVAVLHINEDLDNSIHLAEKERGFRDYFLQNGNQFSVRTVNCYDPSALTGDDTITGLLSDGALRGVFVTTSHGTALMAGLLEQHGKRDVKLIGYDLLTDNVRFLKKGVIRFLIHQNPKRQAFLGINHLVSHLILKKPTPSQDLLPLEIISQQNINSYLDSTMP